MNCLKCGRETAGEQTFCLDCQAVMEQYPVRPGTLVQLPKRKDAAPAKKTAKRRALPLEDQVKLLKKRLWHHRIILLVCILLMALMVYPTYAYLTHHHYAIGQNYTSVSSTTATEAND